VIVSSVVEKGEEEEERREFVNRVIYCDVCYFYNEGLF